MELIPPWPGSPGGWLAFFSAAAAAAIGVLLALAPLLRFRHRGGYALAAVSNGLAGGFCLGLGLCAILFDQPLIYLALGAGWALSAVATLIGMACGHGGQRWKWILPVVQAGLAAMPLAYVFGIVP